MRPTTSTSRPTWMTSIRQQVNEFFFAREIPYGLAVVRIFLPLAMLLPMIHRLKWVRELYSSDGATAQLSSVYGYGDMFPVFSGSVAVALYCAMIVFLLLTSAGWQTRFSMICGTVLYVYFNMLDAVGTVTKYSAIATDVMVAMCFAESGLVLSVDAWRKRKAGNVQREELKSAVWPTRLIQFLLGAIYFGSAMTKIHTPEFFSGEQLRFWMLSNVNFDNPFGEYLATMPAMLVVSAYITVVWETLFLFVVWRGIGRYVMLFVGAMFHIGTWLTLGLYTFPMICLSAYWAFIRQDDAERLLVWCRSRAIRFGLMRRRADVSDVSQSGPRWYDGLSRLPQPALIAVLVLLTCVVGVEAEYQMDLYQSRGPDGPLALKPMDPEIARSMIQGSEAIRDVDKFFSFELGTYMVSGILANAKREFQYDEKIVVQVNLNPPHEDLWLECNLHDSEGRLIERGGLIVTRQILRTNFFYTLNEALEPGQYQFVFLSSGTEVARRTFSLETEFVPPQRVDPVESGRSGSMESGADDFGLDIEQYDANVE